MGENEKKKKKTNQRQNENIMEMEKMNLKNKYECKAKLRSSPSFSPFYRYLSLSLVTKRMRWNDKIIPKKQAF